MESYQLSFNATPTGAKKNLPASGDLFVYESASVATGAETRIKVKPSNGNTIILKPGQRFRNPDPVTDWAMETYNGNDVIDAVFIIGFGEFDDANTLNQVKLDASFANVVTVANTAAQRVPVSMDVTQLLRLDPAYAVNSTAPVMAYTNAKSNIPLTAGTYSALITAAENVNGVIIEQIIYHSAVQGNLMAKTTPPVSYVDGDQLDQIVSSSKYTTRQKVAAGKAVWVWNNSGAASNCSVLYTAL